MRFTSSLFATSAFLILTTVSAQHDHNAPQHDQHDQNQDNHPHYNTHSVAPPSHSHSAHSESETHSFTNYRPTGSLNHAGRPTGKPDKEPRSYYYDNSNSQDEIKPTTSKSIKAFKNRPTGISGIGSKPTYRPRGSKDPNAV